MLDLVNNTLVTTVLVQLLCNGFPSEIYLFQTGSDLSLGVYYSYFVYKVVMVVNTCI
jgi:hypothetical protein